VLDGSGIAELPTPKLSDWPDVTWQPDINAIPVDLNTLTPEIVATWKAGDRLLLNGKLLTGRDAAHKRIADLYASGEGLPPGVDFTNRMIYYVGPVGSGARGSSGARRANDRNAHGQVHRDDAREDRTHRDDRQGGTRPHRPRGHPQAQGSVPHGCWWRGVSRVESHSRLTRGRVRRSRHGSDLRIRCHRHAVTVAVDAAGSNVHETGPREWQEKIRSLPVLAGA
jgi:fumarate hydratase class I